MIQAGAWRICISNFTGVQGLNFQEEARAKGAEGEPPCSTCIHSYE